MKRKGLMTIALLAALNMQAQEVNTYTPGMIEDGVVYYLPKTILEIKVVASKSKYTPGELCQYANRYLKLQNISAQPSEEWSIKSVEVNAIGTPDETKAYSVKLKDKSVASQVELTENGIIKAINTTLPKEKPAKKEPEPQLPKRLDPRSFMTEEILMAGSSNKMAELVAQEIYSIRESKNSLIRGQADYMPQDGSALNIMLHNLEIQEKAMIEMFSGITEVTDQTFTFYIEPAKDFKEQILFRFSKKLGVLKDNNLAGEPIFISISDESALPATNEAVKAGKKIEGIIYNIPGKGRVSIESMDYSFYEEELNITQFGETEVLVDDLFNKKVNTRVIFNPTTGGIVKIDKD